MTTKSYSDLFDRVRFKGNPLAHPESMVVSDRTGSRGRARFTVLTPRLLRLEWSETGEFEDRGTYAFPTRYAPVPAFTIYREGRLLTVETGALVLRYVQSGGRFTADNLSISFMLDGERQTWVPDMTNPANLRGTRRTLDDCEGDAALEEGLLSREGWVLFDDSRSVLFDPDDGWLVSPRAHEVQDWYFFGYGHDYKDALAEYARFGGSIPLIPRYVLGAWWSRYWTYSAQDLKELVHEFEKYDLPLDVLVVDMDWHTPHSWTGYTWNRELFPDPPAFLRWVRKKGLRVALNLHPAEGVQAFEEVYPRFAREMGVDPDNGEAVPFRITDRQFVENYFKLLHHPMEDDGVDFWWMDWQQGETSEMEGLDPLSWINHLHFGDSTRRGRRPMLYSRWGGLGNHRYQTGFSGDTWVGWPALQFQPHFTATASNVLYGWWGHDIGGHMGDATEPELYARWVQYGALSPSLRLHATKDPLAERRPWKYPEAVYRVAKAAFHWRYQLVPYIYTMARIAHDTGVSLCRPMYYEYPQRDEAYAARYQYFFGDQMIVAPIVQPIDPETGLATTDVWVPEGTWIEYTTKETFTGPRWVRLAGDLEHVPMLMKAGAILPLATPFEALSPSHLTSGTTDSIPRDSLVLSLFPGERGIFRLYEDDGITEAYELGQHEWTEITTRMDNPNTWVVHIAPVDGHCSVLPRQRGYKIRLEGSQQPNRVMLNGMEVSDWCYDPQSLRTTIRISPCDKSQSITVTAVAEEGIPALGMAHNRSRVLSDAKRLLSNRYPAEKDGAELLDAILHADVPGRADAIARLGGPLVRFVEFSTPEEAMQQLGRVIVGAPVDSDESFDVRVTWTLFQSGEKIQRTVDIKGVTGAQILDSPFAFDGQVRTMYWTAKVRLTWRRETLVYTYQSRFLFPTIYAWWTVVYNRQEEPLTLEQVVDAKSKDEDELDWKVLVQTVEGVANVNQPHGIRFSTECGPELKAGVPLAAYMVTTIISPEKRDAVLRFRSAGAVELYLNGNRVREVPVEQEGRLPSLLRRSRRTATVHLHAGRNTLVVHTVPPKEKRSWWHFGGAFTTPDGDLMTNLAYE